MNLRPKAKRRIALLAGAASVVILAAVVALHVANHVIAAKLETERGAAMSAYRAGDYAGALPHLGHYLDKAKDSDLAADPKYANALLAYGFCRMRVHKGRGANLVEAKSIFQNYLALRPDDIEAQHALLTLYPRIDYKQEQLALADAVLAKRPDDAPALVAKIEALSAQVRPDYAQAMKVCDHLNAADPLDLRGQLMGMELRLRLHVSPADLLARAASLRDAHKNDPRFELVYAATCLGVSHAPATALAQAAKPSLDAAKPSLDAAKPSLDAAKPSSGAAGPSAPTTAPSTSQALVAEGRRWLSAAAEKAPPDAEFVHTFIDVLDRNGLYPLSLALLQKDAPLLKDADLSAELVRRLWENGYAQDVIDRTAALDPSAPGVNPASLALRASAMFTESRQNPGGHPAYDADARALVANLIARGNDPTAVAWAMALSAEFGPGVRAPEEWQAADARGVIKQCDAALDSDPENEQAYLLAGQAYATLGEKESAAADYERAAAVAPAWATPLALLGRLRLTQDRPDAALARAQAAVLRAPQLSAVRATFALAWYAALRNAPRDGERDPRWERLLAEVESIQKQWPHEAQTLPTYVTLLAESGRRDEAQRVLRDAAALKPALGAQTLLALDQVNRDDHLGLGGALVDRARAADGASMALALRHATDLLTSGDAPGGLAALKSARDAAPGGPADPRWGILIAAYLERAHDPADADAWIALGDKNPDSLAVQSAALQSATRFAHRDFWDRSIQRLKKLTGEQGQLWQLERCRWLLAGTLDGDEQADQKRRSEAIAMLSDLTRQFPGEPEPHLLLGSALEGQKQPSRAAEEYSFAATLRPGDPDAALALARVQRELGKADDARVTLDRVSRFPGLTPPARLELAEAWEKQGSPDRAIELLKPAASSGEPTTHPTSDPSAVAGLNDASPGFAAARDGLLARCNARLGRFSRAEALYESLLDDPTAPAQDLADAAAFFAAVNQGDKSSEFLARLAAMKLAPGVMPVILGHYHERFGQPGVALHDFTDAVESAPDNPATWRELTGYRLRLGQYPDAAAAAAAGIKAAGADPSLTALARDVDELQSLHGVGDLRSLVEAINRNPEDPAVADLLRALTESQRLNEPPTVQINRLKEVTARHPDFVAAQERLIFAYLRRRQFQDAADVANAAMGAAPYDPTPARLATGVYLAWRQMPQVLDAAGAWRQRSGSDTLPADLAAADALVAMGRAPEAVERLAHYLPAAATRPSAPATAPSAPSTGPNFALYRGYGAALIAAGRSPEAAALLTPLLDSSAEARHVWIALASFQKTDAAAHDWLEQIARRLAPDSVEERLDLADAWRQASAAFGSTPDLESARAILTPMARKPDAPLRVWSTAAEIAQDLGDYALAEQSWRQVLQAESAQSRAPGEPSPVQPEVNNNLAYILMVRGNKAAVAEARALARQAVAAEPDNSNFYDTLARVYAWSGDRESAIKAYRSALEKNADNLDAMIGLADSLAHGGGKDDATAARALLGRIDAMLEASPNLSGPVQAQLKSLRARASLDPDLR